MPRILGCLSGKFDGVERWLVITWAEVVAGTRAVCEEVAPTAWRVSWACGIEDGEIEFGF
jgi:hypothetical protein